MVVAVVGTMKAGKSTTINAIVGTEILPNRNKPMTALPTLIRHTPGQEIPVLKFKENKPINELILDLHYKIKDPKNQSIWSKLIKDPDMNDLRIMIDGKAFFKTEYEGRDGIYWFLKCLNDLVRLSSDFGVSFPFDSYSQVSMLPVIEVEFFHLRGKKSTGQLTLLDTPGPNEAGQQTHLRTMLKEQLSKASAVMAVMDYTQLKSVADAEVRVALQQISAVAKGRIYALVNKFDQRDRNSDSTDAVKSYVAENLMNRDAIFKDFVFPVSSNQAYLAKRALHEIDVNGCLRYPDKDKDVNADCAWVKDFGEEAFGKNGG
jgi:replication fork clamp-binding protein CrfC